MSTLERAYERLVAANPIPDVEHYIASAAELDATLRDPQSLIEDAAADPGGTTGRHPVGPRRWQIAVATFVAVLAVGGVFAATPLFDDADIVNTSPESPLEVVNAFFERWNAGNVEAVMTLIDPATQINGGLQEAADLRSLIEYSIPFDGRMETVCSPGPSPGRVMCDWAWLTEGTEALGLDSAEGRGFTVVDNRITALTTPNFGTFDRQLSRFAQERDPGGYTDSCSPDGISPIGGDGFPFNTRCGRFLADLESAFVADLP